MCWYLYKRMTYIYTYIHIYKVVQKSVDSMVGSLVAALWRSRHCRAGQVKQCPLCALQELPQPEGQDRPCEEVSGQLGEGPVPQQCNKFRDVGNRVIFFFRFARPPFEPHHCHRPPDRPVCSALLSSSFPGPFRFGCQSFSVAG